MTSGVYISSITLPGEDNRVQIEPSTVTVIVGGNNTGKTTLLRQISEWLHSTAPPQKIVGQYRILRGLDLEKGEEPDQLVEWIRENSVYQQPHPTNPHAPTGYGRPGVQPLDSDAIAQAWRTVRGGHLGLLAGFLVSHMEAGSLGPGFSTNRKNRPDDPPAHYLQYLESSVALRENLDKLCLDIFGQNLTLDKLGPSVVLRIGKPESDIPPPGYNDDEIPYRRELDKLELLDTQGHGMKSLLGKLLPIATAAYPIVLIDEPEAFLHPPQASKFGRILGEITQESGVQVIVATHDRNILIGLLESKSRISVVRLTRQANTTCAYQLSPERIADIWSEPALRYSHILDGLFHQRVVIVENERDCTFYSAALDVANEETALPVSPSDILFVPTNGKDGIAPVAEALGAIKVPVVASPDIDILDDPTKIKRLVESLGHDWSNFDKLYRKCTGYLREPREPVSLAQVAESIRRFLDKTLGEDPDRKWDVDLKEEFRALTRSGESRWDELKKYGVQAFKNDVEAAAATLLDKFDSIGLVIVREGELESFARGSGVTARKGLGWLRAALDAEVHKTDAAIAHVRKFASVRPNVIDDVDSPR